MPVEGLSEIEKVKSLNLRSGVLGASLTIETPVHLFQYQDVGTISDHYMSWPGNLEKFAFLQVDEASGEIIIPHGKWTIDEPMIIPEGYVLKGFGPLEIVLNDSAFILSRSPIVLSGDREGQVPVKVYSEDSTGQGLIVVGADEMSALEGVAFENLSRPRVGQFEHEAVLTFYESDVQMNAVTFSGGSGASAIECSRSWVLFNQLSVHDVSNDAIRLNYCHGQLDKLWLQNIDDDGLVIIGGSFTGANHTVREAKGSGFSIREHAKVQFGDAAFTQCGMGLEVRDAAEANFTKLTIAESELGVKAHQKGQTFGPATVTIDAMEHDGQGILQEAEDGSSIQVGAAANEEEAHE